MCKCNNVEFGDYSNMVIIDDDKGNEIQVDKCIADEILHLNNIGIKTIQSCCGHNKNNGFIAVEETCISKMKELGYKEIYNPYYPNSNNSFLPKSNY